ncbi:hypothetical protein RDWZM_000399 [Blomia tropicalis]|uniref:Uncharacterized protein n=1 Tax=Blomia tropicalis TaxID=40697 RepID=A0A9Q0MAI1_BLOTA|nr:hypothetical protein RDWZM_000399 [Blomia tropicalis]
MQFLKLDNVMNLMILDGGMHYNIPLKNIGSDYIQMGHQWPYSWINRYYSIASNLSQHIFNYDLLEKITQLSDKNHDRVLLTFRNREIMYENNLLLGERMIRYSGYSIINDGTFKGYLINEDYYTPLKHFVIYEMGDLSQNGNEIWINHWWPFDNDELKSVSNGCYIRLTSNPNKAVFHSRFMALPSGEEDSRFDVIQFVEEKPPSGFILNDTLYLFDMNFGCVYVFFKFNFALEKNLKRQVDYKSIDIEDFFRCDEKKPAKSVGGTRCKRTTTQIPKDGVDEDSIIDNNINEDKNKDNNENKHEDNNNVNINEGKIEEKTEEKIEDKIENKDKGSSDEITEKRTPSNLTFVKKFYSKKLKSFKSKTKIFVKSKTLKKNRIKSLKPIIGKQKLNESSSSVGSETTISPSRGLSRSTSVNNSSVKNMSIRTNNSSNIDSNLDTSIMNKPKIKMKSIKKIPKLANKLKTSKKNVKK